MLSRLPALQRLISRVIPWARPARVGVTLWSGPGALVVFRALLMRPATDGARREGHPPVRRLFDRQLVVSAPKVLHKGMPTHDDSGTAVLLEPTHRSQPRLRPAVVGLDTVVGVLLGPVPRCRHQLLQRDRVGRCPG